MFFFEKEGRKKKRQLSRAAIEINKYLLFSRTRCQYSFYSHLLFKKKNPPTTSSNMAQINEKSTMCEQRQQLARARAQDRKDELVCAYLDTPIGFTVEEIAFSVKWNRWRKRKKGTASKKQQGTTSTSARTNGET
jgi:hypothetical protein